MGLHDRDYMHEGRPGGPTAQRVGPGWSATTWLILVNCAVFLPAWLMPGLYGALIEWGHFSTLTGLFGGQVWRFVTFQFLHANLMHIFFNMFGLFMLGRLVEDQLGPKKYLAFYLVCGIFGAVLYMLLNLLGWGLNLNLPGLLSYNPQTPLVGASAGVFGVVMACAYIAPNARIQLLLPPIPLRMKTFAYGYVAITVVLLLANADNAGGNAAHLGGAAAGWYFIRNSHHLIDFFDVLNDSRKPRPRGGAQPRRPRAGPDQAEVDRVLRKVKDSGLGSLSARERRTLRDATDSRR